MTTELLRSDDALADRVRMLRAILPTLATEVAIARREAGRLRRENAALQARIGELENRSVQGAAMPLTPPPAPLRGMKAGGTVR